MRNAIELGYSIPITVDFGEWEEDVLIKGDECLDEDFVAWSVDAEEFMAIRADRVKIAA